MDMNTVKYLVDVLNIVAIFLMTIGSFVFIRKLWKKKNHFFRKVFLTIITMVVTIAAMSTINHYFNYGPDRLWFYVNTVLLGSCSLFILVIILL